MEFTRIPGIEKKASRIGLGTWAIGGWMWGGTDEQSAIAAILKGFDKGITVIDTAPVYGFGKSEEIVGKAIKEYGKREQIIIATKVGMEWKGTRVFRNSSRARILQEVEDSLKRLQVEYIDLYQVHWPDENTPFSETASTMKELLETGRIRAIGVSNFSPQQMDAFRQYASLHTDQAPFNLFEREIEKTDLAYCLQHEIATLGYGSLCRGLLSGKMRKDTTFRGDDLRRIDPKFRDPNFSDYLQCVGLLKKWVKEKHQRSVLALAIRWALDKGISTALWGVRKPEQLEGIDEVWGWKLSPSDFQEIDQILTDSIKSPIGAEFMAPPATRVS
jgi:aryl-alcohol dehydrogenase-like predicted oxidoreductase